MMFTSPMRLLTAIALTQDSDAIAKELLALGALEMVSIRELAGTWGSRLSSLEPVVSSTRLAELRRRAEGFMLMGSIKKPAIDTVEKLAPVDISASEKRLDSIASDVNAVREKQKIAQDEILKLDEMRRQIESFGDLKTLAAASSSYSFLTIHAGLVAAHTLAALEDAMRAIPSAVLPSTHEHFGADTSVRACIIITLKRDERRLAAILEQFCWQDTPLPNLIPDGDALSAIDIKIEALKIKQKTADDELSEYFKLECPRLCDMWAELRSAELIAKVRSGFSRTERTVLFSGWIPEEKTAQVEAAVRKAASGGCSIEWTAPKQGEAKELAVPVEVRDPKFLKPFENLVFNYAVPEYGVINPTPFVAVSYLVMFGLMFGDAGHGFVVMLAGIAGLFSAQKKGKSDTLFKLMIYCGMAAMAAGVIFGSYFGMAWFPPLWFDYHNVVNGHTVSGSIQSISDVLGITLRFGIAVLGTGFVINWINLARKKDWFTLLFDKAGLLGGWIYAAGTWTAFYYVAHKYKEFPNMAVLGCILGIPTLILVLKVPAEFFIHAKKEGKRFRPSMIMDFCIGGMVEILEVYSGYLANTLSFMRVAGLGIAHVSLMTAFFQIGRMISPEGPFSVWAILVIILGNILVIALEGLSAGIQSLRLNYYEFFSKYFNGTGRAFRPISFNSDI